jgi:hypothetical protein
MIDKKTLRAFGFIWAILFLILAWNNEEFVISLCCVSLFFLVSASFFPEIYVKTFIFQGWIKFGNFLGNANSKIIIFLLFFGVFLPIALILKILKKDLLNKKIDKNLATYFKLRDQELGDMKNQF